ncbi:MAG: hypothetical protein EA400_00915 [Chromatiaceae bacterium]|nr:MAG: hypothetical protein EA400_00915 [Chromatiaceae bacterium]
MQIIAHAIGHALEDDFMNNKLPSSVAWLVALALWLACGQTLASEMVPTTQQQRFSIIRIPLIEYGGADALAERVGWDSAAMDAARQQGEFVGCGDRIVYMEKRIPHTRAPLTAIYQELFRLPDTVVVHGQAYQNPIHQHAHRRNLPPLRFERVTISNRKANLYLVGDYLSVGTCEPARTEAVLQFAALQFATVDEIAIYLNGEPAAGVFMHGGPNDG